MADENKSQGRQNGGHARNNVGETRDHRESTKSSDSGFSEGIEEMAARVHGGVEAVGERAREGFGHASKAVAHHPGSSVLLGLGLGFGVGLALTALLSHREETWAERYVPDSLRKRQIPESVRTMPDAMHATFHHLAESIKDLPSALVKMMPSR